jgi:hypothetical protein
MNSKTAEREVRVQCVTCKRMVSLDAVHDCKAPNAPEILEGGWG